MLANLASPLLGMVDNATLGHLDNPIYLSAMGLSVSLFTYLLWGFNFLSISCCSFTAQAYSQNQHNKVLNILIQYLLLALSLAIILLITLYFTLPWLLSLAVEQHDIRKLVKQYLQIRLISLPAILSLQVLIAWFAGLKSPKVALWVLISSLLINAILDYILVFIFNFNIIFIKYSQKGACCQKRV